MGQAPLTGADLLDYLQRPILFLHPDRTAYAIQWRPGAAVSIEEVFASFPNAYEVRGPYGAASDHVYLWFGSDDLFVPLVGDPDDVPSEELTAAAQDAFDLFLAWQEETEQL